jgi:hypothetical protein
MEIKYKTLLLLILSVAFTLQSFAQIEVTTRNEGGNIIFDVNSDKEGSYTLGLKFSELRGYKSSLGNTAIIPIKGGLNREVYKLTKEGNTTTNYRYTYTYYQGKYNAKPNMNYPYILPASEGKRLYTSHSTNIEYMIGKTDGDSILGIVFRYAEADTVCAIRSRKVVAVEHSKRDRIEPGQGVVTYDRDSQNTIIIEHADGTIVRYVCITSAQTLVKSGDRIIAGQPLAVLEEEKDFPRIAISVSYLTKELKHKIIIPMFYTEKGLSELNFGKEYHSASTRDIIEKELTKKEKKNLK